MKNEIIEMLNGDEKAKRLHTKFNDIAADQGLTGKAYDDAKETFLMMLVIANPALMDKMAEITYNRLNNNGGN